MNISHAPWGKVGDHNNAGYVHEGFKDAAKKQREKGLWNKLKGYKADELCFTGHSLGGALAFLQCLAYVEDLPDAPLASAELSLCTFGCPRIGDVAFSDYSDSKLKL